MGETAKLQGVYNINKGYAVFKQISILYQNEEYSIVETGTSYGLSLYDHIALDGSKVNENDLIN
ncbi:MAG: HlyD family efflux transporter periplasmic adaptor subunit [Roseburia sp.]